MKVCLPIGKYAIANRGNPKLRLLSVLILFSILFTSKSFAQNEVTGTVTSGDSAVVGASIQLKGSTVGTQTDVNGYFKIAAAPGSTLIITSVGFVAQEVKVTASHVINVQLLPSVARSMDEVVVVGMVLKSDRCYRAVRPFQKIAFQIPTTT
jgi:hypothetical protein